MLRRRSVVIVPAILALALIAPARVTVSAQEPALADVLAKAAQYAAGFADASRMLVCEERAEQTFIQVMTNINGGVEYKPMGGRKWVAEMVVIASPDEEKSGFPWREFRDVLSQDGKVAREKSRLGGLAIKPLAQAYGEAQAATTEAAGVRLGRFLRAGFLPRIAAVLLHASNQSRFEFKRGGERTIAGVKTREVRYVEKTGPTIFMNGDRPAPMSGSLWIDPATGAVLASTLRNSDGGKLSDETTTTCKLDQVTGLWLPSQITEKMEDGDDSSKVEGTTTFSNWRAVARKAS